MKKRILLFISLFCILFSMSGQIDGNLLLGLTHATTAELATINNPIEGSILYNSTEKTMVQFNGTGWVDAVNLPADILDGDDDTTYSAGNGMALSGTTFSVDNSVIAPVWGNILNVPGNLDLDNSNEIQTLSKSGNTIALSNGGGSVNESITNVTQNSNNGIITYTNEATSVQTANVISGDANNSIVAGSDGGAFLEQNITTTTIKVDQSILWTGQVNDPDIHRNHTLTVQQTRSDTEWSFAAPSTLTYTGTPDHVRINLIAVANNTGSYYATPHIKVFRNGQELGEGSYRYFNNNNSYSGRGSIVMALVDPDPGTNPVYTFTTLEDDNRTMNDPTIPSLSPVSLTAIEKKDVVVTISN